MLIPETLLNVMLLTLAQFVVFKDTVTHTASEDALVLLLLRYFLLCDTERRCCLTAAISGRILMTTGHHGLFCPRCVLHVLALALEPVHCNALRIDRGSRLLT